MQTLGVIVLIAALAVGFYYVQRQWTEANNDAFQKKILIGTETLDEIKEHAKEFTEKTVIQVADNVHVAIGYAIANSIMVIGPTGVVIVDVTECYESAAEILKAFRNITDKPITDIIYTHNHADHVSGAQAFVEDDTTHIPNVWAHASIIEEFSNNIRGVTRALFTRAMRQFGVFLPELSAGIGPKLRYGRDEYTNAPVYPTKLVDGSELDVELAGIPMRIVHIPGETDDQIGVWIPGIKAFLCADDVYKAFPNLYAIRGTKSRDLMQWVHSLDKIIDLEPEMLIPSHSRPVIGQSKVQDLLIQYRDAIQYVHDQTVRLINYGYHPDEIAQHLKLPENLRSNPHLKEFYGTVAWSAKSVFIDYLGWFSGDPVELNPLPPKERSIRMVELVGPEKLLDASASALKSEDYQWALELVSHYLNLHPDDTQAKDIKVEALTALGARQLSVNGRNYYLTVAMETAMDFKIGVPQKQRTSMIDNFPIEAIMAAFSGMFDPEACGQKNETLYVELSSPDSNVYIQIRNSIAIVKNGIPKNWDIRVRSSEQTWKNILKKEQHALTAMAFGDLEIDGGAMALGAFFGCFDQNIQYNG